MTAEFGTWLSRAIQNRGWSLRQVARMVGTSHTTVTNVANGKSPPSPELCRDLARVFSMAVEDVFRLADLLPTPPRRVVYDDAGRGHGARRAAAGWLVGRLLAHASRGIDA